MQNAAVSSPVICFVRLISTFAAPSSNIHSLDIEISDSASLHSRRSHGTAKAVEADFRPAFSHPLLSKRGCLMMFIDVY